MSAGSSSSELGGGKGLGQDFDLNLAPIIDCFTVLIAFLLISSTYLSLSILDAGIAGLNDSPQTATNDIPQIALNLELRENRGFEIKASGVENINHPVLPSADGRWNYLGLENGLRGALARWPSVKMITISADANVAYEDVVRAMEVTRKLYPAVLLGGF